MRIIKTKADIKDGVDYLSGVDERFAFAVAEAGMPPLRRRKGGFEALLQVLVSQQLSVAAANGIWKRVTEAGFTEPKTILGAEDEALRACGLSRPKIRYARAMAEAHEDGSLCLKTCAKSPVDDAIAMLTQVKGIGTWTAEIYLMFSVGHSDVFAPKDLALQESARMLFGLDERPSDKALAELAEPWSPWRAVAARILWSYYHVAKGREGVT